MKTLRLLPASLALCGFLLAGPSPTLRAQTIPQGDIVVDLTTFAMLPQSSGQPARVNVLRAAPDGRWSASPLTRQRSAGAPDSSPR